MSGEQYRHITVKLFQFSLVGLSAFLVGSFLVAAQEWTGPQVQPPINNNSGQPPGAGSFTGYLERARITTQTLQSQLVVSKTSGVPATLGGANGNIGLLGRASFVVPAYFPTGRIGVYGYATGSPYGLYALGEGSGTSYGVAGAGDSGADAGLFYGPVSIMDNGSALGTLSAEGAVIADLGYRCLETAGCVVPETGVAITGTHTAGGFGVYGYSTSTVGVSVTTNDSISGNGEAVIAVSNSGSAVGGYGATGGVYGAAFGTLNTTYTGAVGYAKTTIGSDSLQARRGVYGLSQGGLGNKSSYGASFPNYDLAAGVRACVKDAGGVAQNTIGVSGTGGRFSGYFDGAALSCLATPFRTLDATLESGLWNAMAIGSNGYPLIVYRRNTNSLYAVSCGNQDCSIISSGPHRIDPSSGGFIDSVDVAVGGDGLPAIVYRDDGLDRLRFVKCKASDCNTTAGYYRKDVETTGVATATVYASIAVRPNNFPIISYYHIVNQSLKVIACGNADCCVSVACSNITTSLVDDVGNVGQYSSIAINPTDSNLPVISYYRSDSPGTLEMAHCSNTDCTAATITPSIDGSSGGQFTSIAIAPDGLPAISYFHNQGGVTIPPRKKNLKFIKCVDKTTCCGGAFTTCSAVQRILVPESLTDQTGLKSSLVFGVDGYPIVGYSSLNDTNGMYDLYTAKCFTADCSDAPNNIKRVLIDPGYTGGTCITGNAGRFLDLAMGTDGLPVMAYYDDSACTADLKVAKCLTDSCEQACYPQKSGDGGNVMIADNGKLRMGNTYLTLKNLRCILNKAGYTQYPCP